MYQTIHDLPAIVRRQMPDQACELYIAVHNRLRERAIAGGEIDKAEIERTAHDGAMLAVQSEFEVGADGRWHRAPIGEAMDRLGPAADDEAANEASRGRAS